MLSTQERIFLYRYLSRVLSTGMSPKEALQCYCQDNILKAKHTQAIKYALDLFRQNKNLPVSLSIAKLASRNESLVLKTAVRQKLPLTKILLVLADNLTQQNFLRTKIKTLMIYPMILIIELFVILGLTIFWLIPQVQVFFIKLNITAPNLLQFLYSLQQNLKDIWKTENFIWLIIGASSIWLAYQVVRLEKIKYYFEALYLRLPKLGHIYKLIILQNIFSYLSLMTGERQGRNINQALKTTSLITKNLVYKKALYNLACHLQKGGLLKQFWQAKKNRMLFPVLIRRLLILGERSKNYGKDIRALSEILTEELNIELKHFIAILEPVLIILIASFVLSLGLTMQNILSKIQEIGIHG